MAACFDANAGSCGFSDSASERNWHFKNLSVCPTHPSRNSVELTGQVRQRAHTPLCGQGAESPRTQNQAGLCHSAGCFHVEGLRLVLKELRKGSSQGLLS